MRKLVRVAPFAFQLQIWGYDMAGNAKRRQPGDIDLDMAWEQRSTASDYWGHPLWDKKLADIDGITVNGNGPCAKEVYALPYLAQLVRLRQVSGAT